MAATSQKPEKDQKVIRLPRPLRAIAKRDNRKRLPTLSSDDIERMFTHADSHTKILKIAA